MSGSSEELQEEATAQNYSDAVQEAAFYKKQTKSYQQECEAYQELIKKLKQEYETINVSLNYRALIAKQAADELYKRNLQLTACINSIAKVLNFENTSSAIKTELIEKLVRKEVDNNGRAEDPLEKSGKQSELSRRS